MAEDIRVVLVEDDKAVNFATAQSLTLAGICVETYSNAEAALERLHSNFPGILLVDVRLPGMSGMDMLDHVLRIDPMLPVLLITGHGDIAMAVQAMRAGAYDFLEKPVASDVVLAAVQRALEKRKLTFEIATLRRQLVRKQGIDRLLIGESAAIARLRSKILHLADASPDILIHGETGSGKEMVARALHESSSARDKPFVAINCGAIPESMFESELFGHERGAFTGAQSLRIGKVEYAAGGTLFLDEIESMPMALQVKILRTLQARQVERLGSNKPIAVSFRVIAATKTDLKTLAQQDKFRSDLYFRLNVVTLELPPLRERRDDIPLLFEHLVLDAAARYKRPAPLVDVQLFRALLSYDWPGNVRELGNIADRFVLGVLGDGFEVGGNAGMGSKHLKEMMNDIERSFIVDALRRTCGAVLETSANLGIPPKTLYDKLRRYNLTPEEFRSPCARKVNQ